MPQELNIIPIFAEHRLLLSAHSTDIFFSGGLETHDFELFISAEDGPHFNYVQVMELIANDPSDCSVLGLLMPGLTKLLNQELTVP